MKVSIAIAATAVLSAGTAYADCSYPPPPDHLPDGNTATLQEMVEAQTLVGNQRAADETRAWMATANVRDGLQQGDAPVYLYLRMRFGLPPRSANP